MDEVLNELQAFIDRGDQTLTISGGEPTLSRTRLLTLVKTAKEGGIRFIEVQTNATLINQKYAAELAALPQSVIMDPYSIDNFVVAVSIRLPTSNPLKIPWIALSKAQRPQFRP